MAKAQSESLKVGFNGSLKLEFHGSKVTTDAGLLAYRELDAALGLFDAAPSLFQEKRTGRNIQHDISSLLRQSVDNCALRTSFQAWRFIFTEVFGKMGFSYRLSCILTGGGTRFSEAQGQLKPEQN